MPASLARLRSTNTTVLLHKCEVCGADAMLGSGVELRKAFLSLEAGDKGEAKRLLGRWHCAAHDPNGVGS